MFVGLLTILGGIITIGLLLSVTHVILNFILHGLVIGISVLEMIIGVMAIYFGIDRLRIRLSETAYN